MTENTNDHAATRPIEALQDVIPTTGREGRSEALIRASGGPSRG